MKWLTLTEIRQRARSRRGALEVSWEHWNQLYNATAKELRAELKRTNENLHDGSHCGLCMFFKSNCYICIFDDFCVGDLWSEAKSALMNWYCKKGNWQSWKRASKAVRDKLKELMEG